MEILDLNTFKTKIFDFEKETGWKYLGQLPAIVDFYADWCGPCRALTPVLAEISERYQGKIQIYKIDTEASPELAGMFGIRSIPSLLFIPQTGDPTMMTGAVPKPQLELAIKEVLLVE